MSALTDGYRNKRFTQCLELGEPAKLENEQETHERVQQAMQELYSICTTEEAKRSFKVSWTRHQFLPSSIQTLDLDVKKMGRGGVLRRMELPCKLERHD